MPYSAHWSVSGFRFPVVFGCLLVSPHHVACGILDPKAGIKTRSMTVMNHPNSSPAFSEDSCLPRFSSNCSSENALPESQALCKPLTTRGSHSIPRHRWGSTQNKPSRQTTWIQTTLLPLTSYVHVPLGKLFRLIHSFIHLWLHWVFIAVHQLSLDLVSGGYSSWRCPGFSLQ